MRGETVLDGKRGGKGERKGEERDSLCKAPPKGWGSLMWKTEGVCVRGKRHQEGKGQKSGGQEISHT